MALCWYPRWHHHGSGPLLRAPSFAPRFANFGEFRREPSRASSCAARHHLARVRGWTYYSNEYTLHGGQAAAEGAHTCRHSFNALLLRFVRVVVLAQQSHVIRVSGVLYRFSGLGRDGVEWGGVQRVGVICVARADGLA